MAGTIMTAVSITLANDVTLAGRALARDGSVTLLNDIILGPDCSAVQNGSAMLVAAAAATSAPAGLAGSAGSAGSATLDHAMSSTTMLLLAAALVALLIAVSLGEVPERRRPWFAK
jgi:hypothetical protein